METLVGLVITFLSSHPVIGGALLSAGAALTVLAPVLYAAQPWLQKKVQETDTSLDNIALRVFYIVIDKLTPKSAKLGSKSSPRAAARSVVEDLSDEELAAVLEIAGASELVE